MSTNTQYFISKVAEKNGVTYDQVYADMREAILAGFYSTDPEVQAMWKSIPFKGEEPTPEEVIMALATMVEEK